MSEKIVKGRYSYLERNHKVWENCVSLQNVKSTIALQYSCDLSGNVGVEWSLRNFTLLAVKQLK